MYNYSMEDTLENRIKQIERVVSTDVLLSQTQDEPQIKDYYIKNRLAYLLFHNSNGYLHMGISANDEYQEEDLEVAVNQINQEIHKNQYADVVELGSGRGANSFYLANKNPNLTIKAVDLSTRPLAKYTSLTNIEFFNRDFHNLDFIQDESVDLAFGIETFCHSDNKEKLFSEIYRILKPEGRLFIFDGYRITKTNLNKMVEKASVLVEHGMAVNKFEVTNDIESKATTAGFTLETKEDLSMNILPTVRRFEKMAQRFFNHPKLARLISSFLSEKFIRNSVAGYLMVPLIEQRVVGYYKHVFIK